MKNQIVAALIVTGLWCQPGSVNAHPLDNSLSMNRLLAQFSGSNDSGRPDDRPGGGAGRLYEPPPNISDLPSGQATPVPPRQICSPNVLNLKAVVPVDSRGLTTQSQPTFWVYVPSLPSNPKATFILEQVEGSEQVDKFEVSLPTKAGIISIQPKTTLKMETTYRWYLRLPCQMNNPDSSTIAVEGIVKRIDGNSLPLSSRWYDLLSEVVTSPERWMELLNEVGLEDIAKEPLVN